MAKVTTRRARARNRIALGVGIALVLALVGSVWAATSSAGSHGPQSASPGRSASDQVATTTHPTLPNGFPVHERVPNPPVTPSVTPPTAAPDPWRGYQTTVAPGDPIQFATSQVGWRLDRHGQRPILDKGLSSGTGELAWPGTAISETTDAGHTWKTLYQDPTGIWGMDLITTQVGWVVGVTSLERTTDGGATWQRVGEPTGTHLVMVDFVSASLGYGLTTKGTLVRSDDGGETWRVVPTFASFQSTCFSSAGSGIAASLKTATTHTPENLYATGDGGASWSPTGLHSAPAGGFRTTQLSCSGSNAVAVTTITSQPPSGYFVETSSNGGATWTLVADKSVGQIALPPAPRPLTFLSPVAGVSSSGAFDLVGMRGGQIPPDYLNSAAVAQGTIGSSAFTLLSLPTEATWAIPAADPNSHPYGALRVLGAELVAPATGWLYLVTFSVSQGRSKDQWAVLHTSDGGTSWSVQWASSPQALPTRTPG